MGHRCCGFGSPAPDFVRYILDLHQNQSLLQLAGVAAGALAPWGCEGHYMLKVLRKRKTKGPI